MSSIVGVHGVGNYHPKNTTESLSSAWAASLKAGFPAGAPDVDLVVAYYAPELRLPISQGTTEPDALEPDVQALIRAWLTQFPAAEEIAQGRATKPLRAALQWIARRRGLDSRLVTLFVAVFFREVVAYLDANRTGHREAARQVVIDTINSNSPHVVIAHSLGSVVAYEALWSDRTQSIDLFLTLGSPLAMPDVVFDKLQPSPGAGRPTRPPSVNRWVNLADPGDLVAVPRLLSQFFDGIDADLEPAISTFDFHKVKHYLANPTTAAIIHPFLEGHPP